MLSRGALVALPPRGRDMPHYGFGMCMRLLAWSMRSVCRVEAIDGSDVADIGVDDVGCSGGGLAACFPLPVTAGAALPHGAKTLARATDPGLAQDRAVPLGLSDVLLSRPRRSEEHTS